jgi:aminoglycoside/choline kinase family phosphotransferase
MSVKKAIVLAAGFGTRLRPLTCAVPKPLLPVWGEPMLSRIVSSLRARGVVDIVVNCHYLPEPIEVWCAANGCRAVREPEILGTGGVLNPLRAWIGGDDFYLVNGDIVLEGLGGRTMARLEPDDSVIGRCLLTEDGPRTVEADAEGNITCWRSPDPGFPGTYTYCGFALLKAKILDYVEPSGFSSIVQAYERAAMDGRFVRGVTPKDLLWTDAGTLTSYFELNQAGGDNAFADLPQLAAVGATHVDLIGARGSDRCFFRADGGRVVVVYDDATRAENANYGACARYLASRGIPVPAVLDERADLKTLVLSDGGAERKMTLPEYVTVTETLARFHALWSDAAPGEAPFDAALWAWERDLFSEHCLRARYSLSCPDAVAAELRRVAERLQREPPALVHRDFQSTNILWRGDTPTFIDFQGMRRGPAAYDLASLLYDPYVTLSDTWRRALTIVYAKASGRADIADVLPFAAVQRLIQCLGAYGRLVSVGQTRFGAFVLPALENLLAVADDAGLDAVGALAEDLIGREQASAAAATSRPDAGGPREPAVSVGR